MNNKYVSPEVEFILFDDEDTIVTSTGIKGGIKAIKTPEIADSDIFTDPGNDGPVIGR